jgi:VCBS repeat-containing protein
MFTRPSSRIALFIGALLLLAIAAAPGAAGTHKPSPPPPPVKTVTWDNADVTGDGAVNHRDVAFVLRRMGDRCTPRQTSVAADLNHDCRVDGRDLAYVIHVARHKHRHSTPPPAPPADPPANAAPRPAADSATTAEDAAVTIAVLANDTDPDGDTLQVTAASQGQRGTTSVQADGRVIYTPAPNTNGTDTFTYTVADLLGLTATATVTVSVTPVNDPPAVTATAVATTGVAPFDASFSATGADVDGDVLTFSWAFGDQHIASGPQVTHTYADAGTFDAVVTVSDGIATAQASVQITVQRGGRPSAYTVATAAGTGVAGVEGVGGPARAAQLFDPRQVVLAPDGNLYIAEARRLLRVDPAGALTVVRTFVDSPVGDEGPALAVGPDGAVYYTDADAIGYCSEWGQYSAVRVRRLVAGVGPDPVAATWLNSDEMGNCSPSLKFAIDGAGSFYLGNAWWLVKVLPGSTGAAAWSQNVPDFIYALAGVPAGGVYVGGFSSIVKVGPDGITTSFAGTAVHGFAGDGGPAVDAQVGTVASLTVGLDGTVTFLDFDRASFTPRIREVTTNGVIATIGGGSAGFNGDGRPALETAFAFAGSAGVAAIPAGGFYVADRDNARIRQLVPVR